MAQRVSNADSRNRPTHDGQYFDDEGVKLGVMPAVDDVYGLDFGHEHHSLERIFVDLGHTGSHGIPVTLCGLVLFFLDDYRDDLEVTKIV